MTHTKRNADNTYSQFYSLKISDSQWVVTSERYLYCMMWTFFRYSTSRRCISCRDAPTFTCLDAQDRSRTLLLINIHKEPQGCHWVYLHAALWSTWIPSRYQLGTWMDPGGSSRFLPTENRLPISLKSSSCTEDTYTQRAGTAYAGMISILVALAVLVAETDNRMKCRNVPNLEK
jgi:hypothetical protein